jgi:O-antigen/teichoic acid export membrane protein
MSPFLRLMRNGFWILLARIGAQVCMVGVTYLLAHRLGTAGFGGYSFMSAVVLIGNTVTTFGTDMYLIRDVAEKDDLSQWPSILAIQLLLSCVFIGLIYMFSAYLPHQTSETVLALRIYSLALIPLAFFTVFTSVLRGKQRMGAYAGLNIAVPLLLVIAIIIFSDYKSSLVTLAYLLLAIQLAGTVLAGILCVPILPRSRVGLRFLPGKVISLIGLCLPIALIAVVGILYQKLSLTMLSFLGSAAMAGLFSAASRIVEAARMVHVAAYTALYPAMADADPGRKGRGAIRHSFLLLFAIAAAATVVMIGWARPLIDVLFGSDYQSSAPVLKILSLAMIPYTINSCFSLAFLAGRREKTVLQVLCLSLIAALVLNLLLIPSAGLIGAGWAILAAETFQAILFLHENRFHPVDVFQDFMPGRGLTHELPNSS